MKIGKKTIKKMTSLGSVWMIVLALVAGYVGGWIGSSGRISSTNNTNATKQVILKESELISQAAKDAGPSVVSILVSTQGVSQDVFGFSRRYQQQGEGTGFIIDKNGTVITNRHVVPEGTRKVSVTLSDGTKLDEVEVLGRTSENDPLDVAFLKIKNTKGKKLQPISLGDSSKTQVGDKVIAIGNALGQFQNTVTSGILSGYGRSIEAGDGSGSSETLQNLFQTDAAINQGNSGGPLVNINGEVIGINTAVAGGEAQNIGFAIPINDVKGLVKSVLQKGKLLRPYLGVRYVTLTDDYAYEYNLDVKRGAYLAPLEDGSSPVLDDSPAQKAGLKEKDVITHVDGVVIDEHNSLASLAGQHAVGDQVTLTVVRDGKEKKIKATLEAAPTN
jgi:serine protease Do